MPFNSSTAVMWFNQDAFEKAGLDPAKPPATWAELVTAAGVLAAKHPTPIAMTSAWFTWIQFEEFAAIHDLEYATEHDGYDGLGAKLEVNRATVRRAAPALPRHGEGGVVQIHGARQHAGRGVLLRPGRNRLRLVLRPGGHREERAVPLRRGVPAV